MPRAAPKQCRHYGCPRLVPGGGYCAQHAVERYRDYARARKGTLADSAFYWSASWLKARRSHLAHEPLCRACAARGRVTAAEVVDHIVPIRHGGAQLDPENLQSLCKVCHEAKSHAEGSRFGRRENCP